MWYILEYQSAYNNNKLFSAAYLKLPLYSYVINQSKLNLKDYKKVGHWMNFWYKNRVTF